MTRGVRNKINPKLLLSLLDIQKVISSCIQLVSFRLFKKHGYFSVLCPLHSEKTRSFCVYYKSQQYHCYACGAQGNAVNFFKDYYGSRDPVLDLAKFAIKKGWCTWASLRGKSPSSRIPDDLWKMRDYVVPEYWVAPGRPPREDIAYNEDYFRGEK